MTVERPGEKTKFIVVRAWDLMLITLRVDSNYPNDPGWYTLNILKGDSKDPAQAGRREVRLHRDEILKMAEFVGREDPLLKLNDVITPDQLREQMFQMNDPVVQQGRWDKCFDQIEPFANMIAEESRKRRVPMEIAGAWTSLLVCITNRLIDEEKRIA